MEKPRIKKCPKCGGTEFTGEIDVLDTWMDSSITCAVHAGWPDRADWKHLFPASMHPSGTDIIRTWAYYLMVRHLALFDERPFNSVLINGMVLGADGRKMSKSLKNYAAAPEVLNKSGADATRQWAAGGGATGSDIPFRAQDVEYGRRFLVKLWNVAGFTSNLLTDYNPRANVEVDLQPLDKWIISKTENLVNKVTEAYEKCQFNVAIEDIRNFTWHVFCDYYIESVKDRLYRAEKENLARRQAAQQTLHNVFYKILQLLAPITPHLTEEIYQNMYADGKGFESLQITPWPKMTSALVDKAVEEEGDKVMALIEDVRRKKAALKLPLNIPILSLEVYTTNQANADLINSSKNDIAGTLKVVGDFKVVTQTGQGQEVPQFPGVIPVAVFGAVTKK
jgi:valyl-tRNA synthetase